MMLFALAARTRRLELDMTKTLVAALLTALGIAILIHASGSLVFAQSAASPGQERHGDLSIEAIVRTDERYGHDGMFQGPRGWRYWKNLRDPRPIQNPNLWTDTQSTNHHGKSVSQGDLSKR